MLECGSCAAYTEWIETSGFKRNFLQLNLCDGQKYCFFGIDKVSRKILAQLAEVMCFRSSSDDMPKTHISVVVRSAWKAACLDSKDCLQISVVDPGDRTDILALQLMKIASILALDAENRGGMLLHGALAARDGHGILLAGPGGVGKTTASGRLGYPWRSLCDDMTLVVRDSEGKYWAHPWPTWNRFMFGNMGGSWDVQPAVPLRAIFFLAQDETDRAKPVGAGKTATLLVESTEQVSMTMFRHLDDAAVRVLRLRRFDNICDLARALPCFELRLSLTGAFWEEMDRVLDGGSIPEILQVSLGA